MPDFQIFPLHEKPDCATMCAEWSYKEWGWHPINSNIKKSKKIYRVRAKNKNKLPHTWIALENESLVGMASLVKQDCEYHTQFSPWLAGVRTHEEKRGQGIASRILTVIHQWAADMGFKQLYLSTPQAENLYLKNGWQTFGNFNHPDEGPVKLMTKILGS